MSEHAIIVSCEHGGNRVPKEYRYLFTQNGDSRETLNSHRGYDIGALSAARKVAIKLKVPFYFSTTSRLVVDLNRSPRHSHLFSSFTKGLGKDEKEKLLACHYIPYRQEVEAKVAGLIAEGKEVLHLSIHSFTPVLNGEVRNADIGLLYDPSRKSEVKIANDLKYKIQDIAPDLRVRFNYPYLGTMDGFIPYLRKKYPQNYAGLEIELNQQHVSQNGTFTNGLLHPLLRAFALLE